MFLGVKKALILGTSFLVMALVFGIARSNPVVVISSGLSVFVFLGVIVLDRDEKFLVYTYQIGGGLLILLTHIYYPILFGLTLFLIGITMVYFKLRHHTIYPRIGF